MAAAGAEDENQVSIDSTNEAAEQGGSLRILPKFSKVLLLPNTTSLLITLLLVQLSLDLRTFSDVSRGRGTEECGSLACRLLGASTKF